MYDLLIGPFTSAGVGRFFKALDTQYGDKVLDGKQIVRKFFVDQGAVGKCHEGTVVVLSGDGDQVALAHQRLASGVDVKVYAQLLALCNDGVDLVEGQVELVAVFSSPAADTVQITC